MSNLSPAQTQFLLAQRVAHLATADAKGAPHVVPVCYALYGDRIYIAIDEKPKRSEASALKRLQNIRENPQVSLVADCYDDDWSRLGYVLVHGRAEVIEAGEEHTRALSLLRERYAQYRAMALDQRPVITITVERAVSWGRLVFPLSPGGRELE